MRRHSRHGSSLGGTADPDLIAGLLDEERIKGLVQDVGANAQMGVGTGVGEEGAREGDGGAYAKSPAGTM